MGVGYTLSCTRFVAVGQLVGVKYLLADFKNRVRDRETTEYKLKNNPYNQIVVVYPYKSFRFIGILNH